jgi:hypothetical protein
MSGVRCPVSSAQCSLYSVHVEGEFKEAHPVSGVQCLCTVHSAQCKVYGVHVEGEFEEAHPVIPFVGIGFTPNSRRR